MTKSRFARIRWVACAIALQLCPGLSSTRLEAQNPAAPAFRRMADGKQWTAENLHVTVEPSYCYASSQTNCGRYGRLYTWESARRACQSLGDGWRLPTDDEWRKLAKRNGGINEDSRDHGKTAYKRLLLGGDSGFAAVLGGNRTEEGLFERIEAHGFYWTSTESGNGGAIFYNFGRGSLALYRQPMGDKRMALSVRCIGD